MRAFIIFIVISLVSDLSGFCQLLSGVWSGSITQQNNQYGPITATINVNQVGNFLSGEIRTSAKAGFVVEKFRGIIFEGKILMNEYEVVKDSSDHLSWCIKDFKGFFFVDFNENTRVIEGTWTSQKFYQDGTYLNGQDCPPGTFKVVQKLSVTPKAGRLADNPGKDPGAQRIKPFQPVLSIVKKDTNQQTYDLDDSIDLHNIPARDNSSSSIRISNQEFFLSKPKLGEKLTLTIKFEQSKATMLRESKPELDSLLQYLKKYPTLEIQLSGYSDNQGDPSKNITLSFERVNVIKKYLVDQNISTKRITVKGLGSKMPVAPNTNEENRKLNRRVEMIVTRQ